MSGARGGDIFSRGGPERAVVVSAWAAGWMAVTDNEMDLVYSMVKPGTVIHILP